MALTFTVNLYNDAERKAFTSYTHVADHADAAVEAVMEEQGKTSIDDFHSVHQKNPVPNVSSKFGAPMGRMTNALAHDMLDVEGAWRADLVPLVDDCYDEGGAYWGMRPSGKSLYAVQDGYGNIDFFDATSPQNALEVAQQD